MAENKTDATRKAFAAWLSQELVRRGYDVTGLRSGGRSRFAADSGISASTVGRLLRGEAVTDTRVLGTLASALEKPLAEILVRTGVITDEQLYDVQHPTTDTARKISPEEAANDLGITDPHKRELFLNMTRTLQEQSDTGEGEARAE